MKPETHYGLRCEVKDEKVLMQMVNGHLATLNRTTSKAKQPDLLRRYLPFVLKHFYWNLNKDTGTWLDIYPNRDVNGSWQFPEREDCAWLLHVRIDLGRFPAATQEMAEDFIRELITAIAFDSIILQESDDL